MGEVRFGGYRLERLLGKGGMGQVWLAYDTVAARWVALKLLPADLAATGGYRKRFEREAEAVAQLRDPHVPRIHRFGEIDGRLYIDMQFVAGDDLAGKLAAEGPMPPAVAVGIIGHVAIALDVAHRAGLVHRDVKPSNIVVHPSGFTYLIDFGIAHGLGRTAVTTTGMAIGTLAYMAPERFGGTVDGRADVYSLACVLYECLTGSRLYGDTDPAQQMHAHLMAAPPRAGAVCAAVPAALDAVLARGLAKEPSQRYATAGQFAAAARAAIGAPAVDSRAVPPPFGSRRPVTKPVTGVAAAAVASPHERNAHRYENGASAKRAAQKAYSPRADSKAAEGCTPQTEGEEAQPRRTPDPTKVLPQPGPTPTLVATRLDWSAVTPGPNPAPGAHVSTPGSPVRGYADPRLPVGNGYPLAGQPYSAPRRWYQNGSYASGTARPGQPGWQERLVALQARVLPPKPGPVVPPYQRPGVPARKVFPAVQRPGRPPVARRRPGVPVPRRRPRRRRGLLSKLIGTLVVVFLAPFAFAAGCVALITAGSRTGDAGTPEPSLPPSAVAVEHPGPPGDDGAPEPVVGTPVRDGKFEFVVTKVDTGVSRVGLQTAAGSFLIVTLAVRNISDETKWFLPLGQRLLDSQSTAFDHNATATIWQNTQQRLGYSFELRPGQSATTQLVFDLPAAATPGHLELHDFVLSNGVRVRLG
ncbi:serine/threonine-protein kinase [Nocardia barduliensis]|uniref:serine/threonine-protein kinase n=1 Tax=Nocardia barduliensis TaxID=2736643 RepID=UPI0015739D5C|nr:serine/threonine-protein kinase [Nocardia barduliensis]